MMKYYSGIVTGLLLLACTACSGTSPKNEEGNVIPVQILSVSTCQREIGKEFLGTVESEFTSSLSFQVQGQVERVLVNKGERVRKGQLIAVLDKIKLQSTYDASLASLKQAEDAYERLNALYENQSLPEIKLVEVRTKLEQARSMEQISKKNLEESVLIAPFDGVIDQRMTEPGENVLPGTPVVTLLNIHSLKIKISVPEEEISSITQGDKANITVAALKGSSCPAEVSEKSMLANPISHTYDVKLRLSEKMPDLMPGMICKVVISDNEVKSYIVIPNNIVHTAYEGGRFVWGVEQGKAVKYPVEVGMLTEEGVVIRSGLEPGMHIVTAGNHKLSAGTKVIEQ